MQQRRQRQPTIFEWVPTLGQLGKWMLYTGLIVGLLAGLVSGASWGLLGGLFMSMVAGLFIGAPLGCFLVYLYNLSNKPFYNPEGMDEFQRQVGRFSNWLDEAKKKQR